ncbi:hypothetical protein [Aestuariirhabdus litorea]|uniref:Lipoprotein n=1 Tax=Aestuariirhabdus litorea TaxID=2528527 RepID=A0A3P3VR11_9GAMM|nr:hypothetical protein [Aestuariirhabdus litorea]RRJ85232.1 hypothetical protein D0544_09235 [Aestuariirhabdus litorea]RWW98452.1 hypothetical protein DZC74_09220 [Endozoicomonadaceae bacterium GTF-13]
MLSRTRLSIGLVTLLLLSGCAGHGNQQLSTQCASGLETAYQELDFAQSKGFDGSVAWGKAAALLTAAKVQQQFEKYPNCIDKVQRARAYIKQSLQG